MRIHPPSSVIHNLASVQVDRYLLDRSWKAGGRPTPATAAAPAITISRVLGIPGGEIAVRLGAQLGYPVFDRQVLDAVASDGRLGDRIVDALDEGKRSALDAWIAGLVGDRRVIDPIGFHHMVARAIRGIALHGGAIILGRGANFVLRGTDAFRVRLVAPLEVRLRAVAGGLEGRAPVTFSAAKAAIEKHTRERAEHMRRHFHAEIDDPRAYDAIFNLRRLDPDLAAGLILEAYRRAIN
jgi:hypothetical protein